ncbi:DUF2849 domain-containing protein [Rhizobiaceae bacterium]|nr:DUF2849 domain-containing protein [Rhizobiaceae bacterium]
MPDRTMRRPYPPKVVTGNDLMEGDAVWFTADHTWSRDHGDAATAGTAEAADALLAAAKQQADRIVGAYVADAKIGPDGRPAPVHFREVFRTKGPSNYAHGKQEAR